MFKRLLANDLSFWMLLQVGMEIGSEHDQTVLNFSKIKQYCEQNKIRDGLLIGDAGYGFCRYMLTVFRNPKTQQQIKFIKVLSSRRAGMRW